MMKGIKSQQYFIGIGIICLSILWLTYSKVYLHKEVTFSVHVSSEYSQDDRYDAVMPNDTVTANLSGSIRHCSTEERLSAVRKYCKDNNIANTYLHKVHPNMTLTNHNSDAYIDSLPDKEILSLSHELWLDPKNKVIVCMHAKAGCSTWKAILANNVGNTSITENFLPYVHTAVFKQGMKCADEGKNVTEIRHRLKAWYKIVIVRHPFDRLVSSYNEKLAGDNKQWKKTIGSKILARYQQHLPKEMAETGEGVQYKDFIQFILDGARDDHFNGPYEAKCHACILDYDYVVKLETNDADADYIIRNKLQGRTLRVIANARRQSGSILLREGRNLKQYFQELTFRQYDELASKHKSDFGMYGYVMEEGEHSFIAKCSGMGKDGKCC